jgi:hypothetical protein
VDLRSEAASRASIRKVAERATRRREELASVRAEIRDRFNLAADAARGSGATDLYVAFELTKGVPLPAWLTVFSPEIDATDFNALGLSELAEVLDRGIATTDEAITTAEPLVTPDIRAVRQSWRRVAHVEEGDVERDFEILEADYWLATAKPNRIALMTFSTAFVEYEDEMLRLFDAVVSTIRWAAPVVEVDEAVPAT